MGLAVSPLPALSGVPPLSVLAVVSSTLAPSLPLVTFDAFLGSVVCVSVHLPVVNIEEVFMVGMEDLMSKCCLWRPVCVCIMVSQLPHDLEPDTLCAASCVDMSDVVFICWFDGQSCPSAFIVD